MGSVEDGRKVLQDFVAPDLKAIGARLDALEKEMKLRFDHVEKITVAHFDALNKEFAVRLEVASVRLESAMKDMRALLDTGSKENHIRFEQVEKVSAARHETLVAMIAGIQNSLEMEKRLTRLESERIKPEAQHA